MAYGVHITEYHACIADLDVPPTTLPRHNGNPSGGPQACFLLESAQGYINRVHVELLMSMEVSSGGEGTAAQC